MHYMYFTSLWFALVYSQIFSVYPVKNMPFFFSLESDFSLTAMGFFPTLTFLESYVSISQSCNRSLAGFLLPVVISEHSTYTDASTNQKWQEGLVVWTPVLICLSKAKSFVLSDVRKKPPAEHSNYHPRKQAFDVVKMILAWFTYLFISILWCL